MESHDLVGKNDSLYFKLLAVLWLPENDIRGGNERGMMRFKIQSSQPNESGPSYLGSDCELTADYCQCEL